MSLITDKLHFGFKKTHSQLRFIELNMLNYLLVKNIFAYPVVLRLLMNMLIKIMRDNTG